MQTYNVKLYYGKDNKRKAELTVEASSMHRAVAKFMLQLFPNDVLYYGRTESADCMTFGTSASGQRIYVKIQHD